MDGFPLMPLQHLQSRQSPSGQSHNGFALVLVLCFIVLLMAVVMAFFSAATLQSTVSDSSANTVKVNLFAQGAVDTLVGDLKQEIAAGSTLWTTNLGSQTITIYYPSTNITAAPALSGFTNAPGLENVVKVSTYNSNFFPSNAPYNTATNPPANRVASSDPGDSSTNPSMNGRSIPWARWNKPLLIPPKATNDFTPAVTPLPAAPSWILVSRMPSLLQG